MGAVHFVGFRDDRYWNAVKVYGKPDFIHRFWDARAKFGGELHPDDIVIFAKGKDTDPIVPYSFDDSGVM